MLCVVFVVWVVGIFLWFVVVDGGLSVYSVVLCFFVIGGFFVKYFVMFEVSVLISLFW